MTSIHPVPNRAATEPERAAERYELHEVLGRGGMACVYRATDRSGGRDVALKQLLAAEDGSIKTSVSALFEREFNTLAQLRHPHVIAVYDYGRMADGCPFYTMELLDGGDLREGAPWPWREACRLLFDVCSSLALLHSRRLLHRDVSPRNIRCTRDGRAKLIDFGAMAPMSSGGADVVGTPAFVAPETLHRLALDARTDLYSLGATLYHALTGAVPYPARTFADVMAAWGGKVRPPSTYDASIPAALDDLVFSLISVEPALRPPSAFDVMQRLIAIAGLSPSESEAVSRAYLATPSLVGRDTALEEFRARILASRMSRGGAMVIEGPAGIGRSRFLDACVLEAKTLGFMVMRATATNPHASFAIARDLTEHLLEAAPSTPRDSSSGLFELEPPASRAQPARLRDLSDPGLSPDDVQRAFSRLWLDASKSQPLLIAVDDVRRIDAGSAAALASLLDKSARGRTFVLLSSSTDEPESPAASTLGRRAHAYTLPRLTSDETRRLLASLFGEVSNLDMLAREIHQVSGGTPRLVMDMAQHLVDRKVVRYAAGVWTLPQRLSQDDLPRSTADAVRARVEPLSPEARFLIEAHALAISDRLSDREYRALLPKTSSQEVERAIGELLGSGALVGDAEAYSLPNRVWRSALAAGLSAEASAERHRALAEMYRTRSDIAFIYHAFYGGLEEEGLEALARLNAGYAANTVDAAKAAEHNVGKMMSCYPMAFACAERLGKSPRFINELRRWNFAGMTVLEDAGYPPVADQWRAQLERDSGLDLYWSDPDHSDPMARMMRALTGAQQRYQDTPEAERVYTVEEALKLLGEYVVIGIAIGARTQDSARLRSLPPLLEPFVVLAPVLDALWNNAVATYVGNCEGAFEAARDRWSAVLKKLDTMDGTEMPYVREIANAVAYAIGLMEAQLGLPSAIDQADRLERDPYQRVAALQLRRIVRLEQGDWKGAERFRREAEIASLSSRTPQMFKALLMVELTVCMYACDLAGIRDVVERMRPLAALFPGWQPNLLYAEACFHRVRGDNELARAKCEECIALTRFDEHGNSLNVLMWIASKVLLAEALLDLGRTEDARDLALAALAESTQRAQMSRSIELERVLALAGAKLGDPDAVRVFQASIERQAQMGVTGLRMGVSYEARAQIAIWQNDADAFEHYSELTAREYRYGAGSTLGARYDRLLNEAARRGLRTTASLADFAPASAAFDSSMLTDSKSLVLRTMSKATRAEDRAHAALQLVCSSRSASAGQLYLTTSTGLTLAAAIGGKPTILDLGPLYAYLARIEEREADMDDMSTGELTEEVAPSATLSLGAVTYELLVLSCMVDGQPKVVGIAAIEAGHGEYDAMKQAQLLQALASHLLERGDTVGYSLMS
jgi:hypothetical protein